MVETDYCDRSKVLDLLAIIFCGGVLNAMPLTQLTRKNVKFDWSVE